MSEPLEFAWEYVQGGHGGQERNKYNVINKYSTCLSLEMHSELDHV